MPRGRPKNTTGTPIKCHNCGNEWLTEGKGLYVTCPKCRTNVKVPGRTIEDIRVE